MAGNVWEWTQSLYKGYPYDPADGREDLGGEGHRVLRGRAFLDGAGSVRCASRCGNLPQARGYAVGFRVVLVSPSALVSERSNL
jgi:formylglycine-generating enzyme required for sulfatase activity